jgi:hypothetical protein
VNEDSSAINHNIAGKEISVEIIPSALKHGKTELDILAALDYVIYDETLLGVPDKTLVVGFDVNGNVTEVIFHELVEGNIVVFHAMPCRKVYLGRILKG